MTNDATPAVNSRDQLRLVMETDARLTQARVAKEMGVSTAVLSQWLGNSYNGDNTKVESKVRQWLEAHFERLASGGLPQAPSWIDTPTSEKLLECLRYTQIAGDVCLMAGGAGLGKTTTIEHYQQTMPNVWIATMSPAAGSVQASLGEVAVAIGLRKPGDSLCTAIYQHRQIVSRLRGTKGLLVVDESQHLGIQALEQMRAIHDQTHVGLAFVGNQELYSRNTLGVNTPMLSRLLSRIGKRVTLKNTPAAGDVDAVLKAWNINDQTCRKLLGEIANRTGAIRTLTKVLRLASSFAQADNKALCCEYVRAAWSDLEPTL